AGGNADHDRDAEARTAHNTAVNWLPSCCPPTRRTTAPASFTSITGADGRAPRRCDRDVFGDNRHKPRSPRSGRLLRDRDPRLAPPAKELLRRKLPTSRDVGYPSPRRQALLDNPRLILRRPAATPLRARQELEPPETNLRVVVNVQHNYRAKPHPSGKPSTVESRAEEWPPSTAYDAMEDRGLPQDPEVGVQGGRFEPSDSAASDQPDRDVLHCELASLLDDHAQPDTKCAARSRFDKIGDAFARAGTADTGNEREDALPLSDQTRQARGLSRSHRRPAARQLPSSGAAYPASETSSWELK